MKRNSIIPLVACLLLVSVFLVCTNLAMAEPKPIAGVKMPRFLTIKGMADPLGSYRHLSAPVIKNIESAFPAVRMREIPGGSRTGVKMVSKGQADLGVCSQGDLYHAWFSGSGFKKQYRDIRLLFAHPTKISTGFLARKGSGITSMKDWATKKVKVNPGLITYGSIVAWANILKNYGTSWKDIESRGGTVYWGHPTAAMDMFVAGQLNVCVKLGLDPWAPLVSALRTVDVNYISFTDEEQKWIEDPLNGDPCRTRIVVPAGTYKGQSKPWKICNIMQGLIVSEKMSDEVAYNLLWAIMAEGRAKTFGEIFPPYKKKDAVLPKHALDATFIPLHPGAVKFWKDWGYEIPPVLVETNPYQAKK
jgi:TRAP transporter TAXI family solute receptor